MGNSNASKSGEAAKNRRYSRSSGFAIGMDNLKDKKLLKIHLKQISPGRGNFTLTYTDDSSDDFLSVKSTFVFSGSYSQNSAGDERDLFGVSITVNPRGNVVLDGDVKDKQQATDRHPSVKPVRKDPESSSATSVDMTPPPIDPSNLRVTRFLTEKLSCKLAEANVTQTWTVTPSTEPDCIEKSPAEIVKSVSWPWLEVSGAKMSHTAPPGALDFVGEETFVNGTSSIDLQIRIPQLASCSNPPVVCLNEVGGWKLGKKSM